MIHGLGPLPITLMEMVVHGQEDEIYAQYFNDIMFFQKVQFD